MIDATSTATTPGTVGGDSDASAAASSGDGSATARTGAPGMSGADTLRQQSDLFRSLMTQARPAPAPAAAPRQPVRGGEPLLAVRDGKASLRMPAAPVRAGGGIAAAPQRATEQALAALTGEARGEAHPWRRLQQQDAREQTADFAALIEAQRLSQPGPANAPQAAPAADPEAAFAELVERHIRELLVSESGTAGAGGEVRIRLSEAALPDTALSLSRVAGGWQLRADCGSAASRQALQRYAPSLVARFAARALGELQVVVEPAAGG